MRTVIFNLFWSIAFLFSCTNSAENQPKTPVIEVKLNAEAKVNITALNCWVEKERFFVVGICDNLSNEWQKIWLRMTPMNQAGEPIKVNGAADALLPTFSDAVPPRGRTSFMAEWPLGAFSGIPDSCTVTGAGAITMTAGPILIASEKSGVKMLVGEPLGDSLVMVEKSWQLNFVLENPLDMQALHPRVELLVYGTDQRLWFAGVLNPEDSLQQKVIKAEREGPMEPKEKRHVGAYVHYNNLPQFLKDNKIGYIDFQPFEARQ